MLVSVHALHAVRPPHMPDSASAHQILVSLQRRDMHGMLGTMWDSPEVSVLLWSVAGVPGHAPMHGQGQDLMYANAIEA